MDENLADRADSPLVYRSASGERLEYLDVLELSWVGRQRIRLENHQVRLLPNGDRAFGVFLEVLIGRPERDRVQCLLNRSPLVRSEHVTAASLAIDGDRHQPHDVRRDDGGVVVHGEIHGPVDRPADRTDIVAPLLAKAPPVPFVGSAGKSE